MSDPRRPYRTYLTYRTYRQFRPLGPRRSHRLAVIAIALVPMLGAALSPASAASISSVSAAPSPAASIPLAGPLRHLGPLSAATATASATVISTDTTTNWAGYAATGSTYTSVTSTWVQPAVKCGTTDQYAAFWAGLDGYASDSVEQTGTEADCVNKTADYYAWYEMYPSAPVIYSNSLKPGDKVTASVVFSGTNKYVLTFTDSTQGWSHATTKTASGLARSSAEVLVEAPTGSTGILPVSGFGSVDFTGCQVNGKTLGSFDPVKIESPGLTVSAITNGTNFSVTRS